MSKKPQEKGLTELAWEQLFAKYEILKHIEVDGRFQISASQIKKFREPRLMAKFDHTVNLPAIFAENNLAILPITRGDYVISHFDAYHRFEPDIAEVTRASLPTYIQSLDCNNVLSETVALNCAVASGIVAEFLEDEAILSTVSGRMGSGNFTFTISNTLQKTANRIEVHNSQIEIDAAFEGVRSLSLFEAKRDLSEDFLIRQLYYPFRVWKSRVTKPVRPVFLVYSNGIYRLYEYCFEEPTNYNSLALVKQRNYCIEDTALTTDDIQSVLCTTAMLPEPAIAFPQADSFERVINLCELISEQEMSRRKVTEEYAFNVRQTNYYTDAGRYLGLLGKTLKEGSPYYELTDKGKQVLKMHFKQRQLVFCKLILSHRAFHLTLERYFESGVMPSKNQIVLIMKQSNLYNVHSDVTFERRSSTVRGWVNWIVGLANEE